jgi:actin-like ATPase involved in cell morphogenesis
VGSLWQQLQRILDRRTRPTLGLVLGAESIRYILAGQDEVVCEPSMLWRRRENEMTILCEQAIGRGAEGIFIERNRERYEVVYPFSGSLPISAYLLTCIFRYFRRRAAEHWHCRRPGRLVITGRPMVLSAVSLFQERAALDAGFRECQAVEEGECLARALELAPEVPALLIDVGHTGARFWVWRGGTCEHAVSSGSHAGGEEMYRALNRHMLHAHGLEIGGMARATLTRLSDPAAWPYEVKGRDRESGLPRRFPFPYEEAVGALFPFFEDVAVRARKLLGEMQAAGAPAERIVLVGAAADSEELRITLECKLGAQVELRPEPGDLSARGLATMLGGATSAPQAPQPHPP